MPGPEVGRDLGVVDGLLLGVGDEDHDRVGGRDRLGHGRHPKSRLGGQGATLGRLLEPDDDVDAGVAQVQRVGVALAAVADDGDGPAGQRRGIRVGVVVHACAHQAFSSNSTVWAPRSMTMLPVRTNSLMPNGVTSSTRRSISSSMPVASTMTESAARSTTRPL